MNKNYHNRFCSITFNSHFHQLNGQNGHFDVDVPVCPERVDESCRRSSQSLYRQSFVSRMKFGPSIRQETGIDKPKAGPVPWVILKPGFAISALETLRQFCLTHQCRGCKKAGKLA